MTTELLRFSSRLLRTTVLLLAVCVSSSLWAYDFVVDNIYYNATSSNTVAVTYASTSYNSYSGTVNIPSTVTNNGTTYHVNEVEGYAFRNSTGLTAVTIPSSVATFGVGVFQGCTGLTSVALHGNVHSIGARLFADCSNLTSVTLPEGITSLGELMFRNCTSLTTINLPSTLTTIGSSAFFNCTNLTALTLPANVTSIGELAFRGCTGLTTMTIPAGVTSISRRMFANCSNLTSVSILGTAVTEIGTLAFQNCTKLAEIHLSSTTPPTLSAASIFHNSVYTSAKLFVPTGSKSNYSTATFWQDFATIEEETPTSINGVRTTQTTSNAAVYTLNGQRVNTTNVSSLPKGVYIIDGKKTVVR